MPTEYQFEEGQIYEGHITLSGDEAPVESRWIVVAPFGRTHIHSLDTDELHCWPLHPAIAGIEQGTLRLVAFVPDHPAVLLQRIKETAEIRDAHISPTDEALEKMANLLEEASQRGEPYAPCLAGEIIAISKRTTHSAEWLRELQLRVEEQMVGWREKVKA